MKNSVQKSIQLLNYIKHLKTKKDDALKIAEADILIQSYDCPSFIEKNTTGKDELLTLNREEFIPPPIPPEHLTEYLSDFTLPSKKPGLRRKSLEGQDENKRKEITLDYKNYLQDWLKWSEKESQKEEHIQIYKKWFNLSQSLKEDDTNQKQVICGIGLALWSKEDKKLSLPIIYQPCILSLEEQKPYTIKISLDSQPAKVNLSVFSSFGVSSEKLTLLEEKWNTYLEHESVHPFLPSTYKEILEELAGTLDPLGQYIPYSSMQSLGNLIIFDTCLFFERDKPSDKIMEDITKFKTFLEKKTEIELPFPIKKITGEKLEETTDRIKFKGVDFDIESTDSCQNLYFPLAYNQDQLEVARQLANHDAVVVQGPPGTGKSHTIANIICHYLAQGKRLLVTSASSHALDVLREKVPQELRDLTVPLLSSENYNIQDIEKSLNVINAKINQFQLPHEHKRLIQYKKTLVQAMDSIVEQREHLFHQLEHIFEKQVEPILFKTSVFSENYVFLTDLAKYVDVHKKDDRLTENLEETNEIPLLHISQEQYTKLQELSQKLGDYKKRYQEKFPYSDSRIERPTKTFIEKFWKKKQDFLELEKGEYNSQTIFTLSYQTTPQKILENLEELYTKKEEFDRLFQKMYLPIDGLFPQQTYHDCLKGTWIAEKDLQHYQERINEEKNISSIQISLDILKNEDFWNWLEKKQDLSSFLNKISIPSKYKEILSQIHMENDNSPYFSSSGVQDLLKYRKIWKNREEIKKEIKKYIEKACQKETSIEYIYDIENKSWELLQNEMNIWVENSQNVKKMTLLLADMDNIANNLFKHHVKEDFICTEEWKSNPQYQMENLHKLYHFVKMYNEYLFLKEELTEKYINYYKPYMFDIENQISRKMINFFEKTIEEDNLDTILEQWLLLTNDIETMINYQPLFKEWSDHLEILKKDCPHLAKQYAEGVPMMSYEELCRSWNYIHIKRKVDMYEQTEEFHENRKKDSQLEKSYLEHQKKYIECLSWEKMTSGVTEEQSQALSLYISSLSKMGKGDGKRALRHRRNAQEAMKKCYDLVPCWIMPLDKVCEQMPAEIGLFDLVIIDESSQLDITAFLALLRGQQILIVGDDKQVSPTVIINEEQMENQASQMLKDIPYNSEMLPDHSIYDLCNTVFSRHKIMLKEHFRCASPIIEFSNREFYDNRIIPLKFTPEQNRLYPVLIDVYVENGYVDQNKHENRGEAEAIVHQIKKIIKSSDSLLKNKTIGVVSLNSNEKQTLLIQDLIAQNISEQERLLYKISVGTPPLFQGKERDIILISGYFDKCGYFSDTLRNRQALNVACSRAKDQMYVFRSIANEAINGSSLYGKLINYIRQDQGGTNALNDLTPAMSTFEKDVAEFLHQKGFNVRLHAGPGSYDVDIIVEGDHAKKWALQCDGDKFEQEAMKLFMDSLSEQKVLEKVGWTFFRCFASHYYKNPQYVQNEMIQNLNHCGLFPEEKIESPLDNINKTRQQKTYVYEDHREEPKETKEKVPTVSKIKKKNTDIIEFIDEEITEKEDVVDNQNTYVNENKRPTLLFKRLKNLQQNSEKK